jgi:hypothetical protein
MTAEHGGQNYEYLGCSRQHTQCHLRARMYLCNLISSLLTKKSGTYIHKLCNDNVKYSERLKICGLETVCGIEVGWAILDFGYHRSVTIPE